MNKTIPPRLPFKIVFRYEVSRIIELGYTYYVLARFFIGHFINCIIYLLLKGTYKKGLHLSGDCRNKISPKRKYLQYNTVFLENFKIYFHNFHLI